MSEQLEWQKAPECPQCGGPAVPLDPEDGTHEPGSVKCARCGKRWAVSVEDFLEAVDANTAFEAEHGVSRVKFEARREAERKSKFDRAMRGEW